MTDIKIEVARDMLHILWGEDYQAKIQPIVNQFIDGMRSAGQDNAVKYLISILPSSKNSIGSPSILLARKMSYLQLCAACAEVIDAEDGADNIG